MFKHKFFLVALITLFVFSGSNAYSQKSKYDFLAAHERSMATNNEDTAKRGEADKIANQQTFKSIYNHWDAHARAQAKNRESKPETVEIKLAYNHLAAHERAKEAFLAQRIRDSFKK